MRPDLDAIAVIDCPSPEYLAGYFDGEGCVFLEHAAPKSVPQGGMTRPRIVVTLGNTYTPIILAIHRKYGGSIADSSSASRKSLGLRPFFQTHLKGKHAARFLTDVLPFLNEKRGRANAAMFMLDTYGWQRSHRKLSRESEHMRDLVVAYFRQHPNGHANKKGGAKKGQGRPRKLAIFNSAMSAKNT